MAKEKKYLSQWPSGTYVRLYPLIISSSGKMQGLNDYMIIICISPQIECYIALSILNIPTLYMYLIFPVISWPTSIPTGWWKRDRKPEPQYNN